MGIVFDILHLAVGALLAVIGLGYEREADCPPVRFEPAAHVETTQAVEPGERDAVIVPASDCDGSDAMVRFPAL